VGVDEDECASRDQEYLSIFCRFNRPGGSSFAVEGRDSKTWQAFVQALEAHHGDRARRHPGDDGHERGATKKESRKTAAMPRWFLTSFTSWPRPANVFDQVRRAELRLDDEEAREALRKTQWLWRKNPET